ncbi:MAG: flagellar hook-length control protein FliK, partial [Candidatus Desulforudis sp.]|nr:flagellar hook-length control protein FliK [Desulforudis sp.]
VQAADDKRSPAVRVQAAVGRPGPGPDPEARPFVARVQSTGAERPVIQGGPRQERVEAAGLKSDAGPAEKSPAFRIGAPPAAEPARHVTQNAVTERLIVPTVPGRQSSVQGPSPVVSEPVAAPRGVAEPEIPAVARQLTEAVMLQVRRLPAGTGQSLRVRIALEPPQLGRVTLRLTFGREGLEVRFYTPDRAVKEIIEQALPQLREALVRQEVNLGNTSVLLGQENPHQQSARLFRGPWTAGSPPEEHAPETADDVHQEGGSRSGVDYLV